MVAPHQTKQLTEEGWRTACRDRGVSMYTPAASVAFGTECMCVCRVCERVLPFAPAPARDRPFVVCISKFSHKATLFFLFWFLLSLWRLPLRFAAASPPLPLPYRYHSVAVRTVRSRSITAPRRAGSRLAGAGCRCRRHRQGRWARGGSRRRRRGGRRGR